MVRSLTCCLKFIFLILLSYSCSDHSELLYKKEFNETDVKFFNDCRWFGSYYQGTVAEEFVIKEGLKWNSEKASLWRELGIAYLKRGIPVGFYPHYEKAVAYDPVEWQGYRAYIYLYFYRDYERAIADFNALDTLTPNFVDHPQALSVDYMRGICYLKLNEFEKALQYFDKHIQDEIETVGGDYLATYAFLYKGISHFKMDQLEEAIQILEKGHKIHDQNADLLYWLAKCYLLKGEKNKALNSIKRSSVLFKEGYHHSRSYTEDFYRTYLVDIEQLAKEIHATI